MPSHFTPALFDFLSQLRRHNRRNWFLKNKGRYESDVRDPALAFIADIAPRLRAISPYLVADPRPHGGSLFRIYRDTRFSADKKPYKTHTGMHFPHAKAGDDVHVPGYYFHLEPGESFLAAGIWRPDAPTTYRIRRAIVASPQRWKKAHRGFELEGDRLQRPPHGFPASHPMIEDLKWKDFLVSTALTDREICSAGFLARFARECRRMAPLVGFLSEAVGLKF
jgi:uncharacterized protein (TIGR02453 family)